MPRRPLPWFAFSIFLAAAITLFARLRSNALLSFYDDAFYYFQIARNIASGHGSTFDGTHLTNGYHPLWMLTLVALNLLASGKTFFFLLQCVALASVVTTFLAAQSVFRRFSTNRVLTQIAAAAIALQCLQLVIGGMEVTLTIPLALCLCLYRLRPQFRWTSAGAFGYGFLAALVVLSRLDSVLWIGLLLLLDFALERPALRGTRVFKLYAVLSCAIPVLLYAWSNHAWFHIWVPVSSQAKQMRMHSSLGLVANPAAFDPINFPYRVTIVYPALLVLLLLIASLFRPGRLRLHRSTLAVAVSLVIFPILQLVAFLTVSDWPIWPWYLYSLPLAMTGCLLLLFEQYPTARLFVRPGDYILLQGSVALLALLFASAHTVDRDGKRANWYLYAKDIEAFSQTHDGIYAMGDCAGTASYLIHQPLVQLEGLTMDAAFLQNIREQRNLNQVLSRYDVRYYVTLSPQRAGECYLTREPMQAGPDSPHMRGSFCQEPVATYPHPSATVYIFDLKPTAAPNSSAAAVPALVTAVSQSQ